MKKSEIKAIATVYLEYSNALEFYTSAMKINPNEKTQAEIDKLKVQLDALRDMACAVGCFGCWVWT